jgi:hypothetical protein
MKRYLSFTFIISALFLFRTEHCISQSNSSTLVAGFDTTAFHPVFIKSKDNKFLLNIGMYTQFRYIFNLRENMPDTLNTITRGYNLARTRIFFEGKYSDKFYYHFRTNINSTGNFELFVAFLQWNIKKNMYLRMGRQFMALGREDWMYPQDLASIEFSAHDFTYALWSSFGFQFHQTVSDKFRYWLSVGNGAYGGRRSFPTPNSSDATIIGRAEWNIVGLGWSKWGDMVSRPGTEFGMMVGAGIGHVVRRDNRTIETDYRDGTQVNLDYSIAGDGFHFFAHGSLTSLNFDSDSPIENRTTEGFYSIFGYWFSDHIFSYARFDYNSKGNREDVSEDYASPGLGLSYYPFKNINRTRFSIEYNLLPATVNNTVVEPDGQLGLVSSDFGGQQSIVFQAQFGF